MKLSARLVALMAALSGETDPAKRAALTARIAKKSTLLAAKAKDGDDDPDDDGDDDEDDEEEKSKAEKAAEEAKKAKKAAEAAKHRAKAAEFKKRMEEAEEEAKRCEAEDDEEAEAKGRAEEEAKAISAGGARAEALLAQLAERTQKLEASALASTKARLITGARQLGAITKAEAAWLEGLPVESIEGFLQLRAKGGFVVTSEGDLVKPKAATPGTEESLPKETLAIIEQSLAGVTGEARAKLRKELIAANLKAHNDMLAAANGAGPRY